MMVVFWIFSPKFNIGRGRVYVYKPKSTRPFSRQQSEVTSQEVTLETIAHRLLLLWGDCLTITTPQEKFICQKGIARSRGRDLLYPPPFGALYLTLCTGS